VEHEKNILMLGSVNKVTTFLKKCVQKLEASFLVQQIVARPAISDAPTTETDGRDSHSRTRREYSEDTETSRWFRMRSKG